ncbi:MAG: ribosomal small subunit methyltransferase [Rhizobacter sp.]|nr:ribosomal small subunit methyltransferase [Rhizobacter sp.]
MTSANERGQGARATGPRASVDKSGATSRGRLFLVPNTLDFGVTTESPPDLQTTIPRGVIDIAARLEYWVVENAKTTRAFLKRVDAVQPLAKPLQALQIIELPRPQKGGKAAPADLSSLLAPALQGHDIGLISEAGLPAIADPGAALVSAAHALDIEVVPMAGPSSLLMALGASGLNGQSFAFVGYLPVESDARAQRIKELEGLSRRAGQTQIMIETPYRNPALLGALLDHLQPSTRLSVSWGLTLPDAVTRSELVSRWRSASTPLPADIPADIPAVFCLLAG